jgi:acyl-CoA synthetase (AMP-forming)/AMP-acid ligase II
MLDAYLSPFKTKSEILRDGWFNTGDLIEEIPRNGFKILGRSSSAMHIGAHKVFPEEIEDKIKQLEGVKEARVYGIPHDLFGSEIRAEVISSIPLDEKEIISYLRKTLGSLKCPKKIDFVDSIELTNSGKIKRS